MARMDVAILIAGLALGAGVAVPRQVQLADADRRQAVEALGRNAASALAVTRNRWEQAGRPVTLPGSRGTVAVVNGYPSVATLPLLLSAAETVGFVYSEGRWQHRDGATAACGVSYLPPADGIGAPTLQVTTDGC